ncbi:MAG TPA: hypothetical protein VM716_02540 [Gemmatimonadales bacterium]|nr:hypothetical protein [Gemmatimonadales bacterium]
MIALGNIDGRSPNTERDELWIQYAVEHYYDTRGCYPPTLAPALADHPNALIALDHLGWTRVHYELHDTRGYVLAFLRPRGDQVRPVLKIEDRQSYLKKLSALQQVGRPTEGE